MFGQNRNCGPVSIVGSPHTGTSLLRNILDRHSDLHMISGESHFFQNLTRIERSYNGLDQETKLHDFVKFVLMLSKFGYIKASHKYNEYTLSDLGISNDAFHALMQDAGKAVHANPKWPHIAAFRATMSGFAHLCGKIRWGEKTPIHVHFIDSIVLTMPDVRIVELVRDPRSVIASRKARSTEQWRVARASSAAILNKPDEFDPILDSYRWRSAIRAGTRAKKNYPGYVLRIRYEDLVQDPTLTIEEVCRFIGIRFDPNMLQVGWVNSASMSEKNQNTPGIGMAAIEKWRELLSAGEIGIIQWILRGEMTLLGYSPAPVGLRGFYDAPLILVRGVIGLLSYLYRVIKMRGIHNRKLV